MDWADTIECDEPFTIVESRKAKSARQKLLVIVSRPTTHSQAKNAPSGNISVQNPSTVATNHTKPSRFK
jgi:hypothetical protein